LAFRAAERRYKLRLRGRGLERVAGIVTDDCGANDGLAEEDMTR
jgi:hypothetical protein